jgi:D-alanyl-D-alanine carboxypeptidase (penicillin-binding protein 5/6)
VELMNQQAKALGMSATTYRNPEGLTEAGHATTARDLGVLATRLMRDFPEYVTFHAIKKYRFEGAPATNDSNRNLLLFRDPSVDGLQTGFTEAAGYCMVATARRSFPNLAVAGAAAGTPEAAGTRRLLSIVLGTASENARANESQKLLNWGFTAFEAVKLFDPGQPVASPAVWKGKEPVLRLGRPEMVVVAVPAGSAAKVKTSIVRPEPLVAPFSKGQAVGTLKVSLADQPLAEFGLQALDDVPQAGLLGRAWDAIRLWIK